MGGKKKTLYDCPRWHCHNNGWVCLALRNKTRATMVCVLYPISTKAVNIEEDEWEMETIKGKVKKERERQREREYLDIKAKDICSKPHWPAFPNLASTSIWTG